MEVFVPLCTSRILREMKNNAQQFSGSQKKDGIDGV